MSVANWLVNSHLSMRTIIILIGLNTASGTLSQVAAQAPLSDSIQALQESDCGKTLGRPVTHPEALSGVWEAPNGKGGAVGIHLQLGTTAPGEAKTLSGTPQSWRELVVGVYERKGATIEFGEENFFSDSPRCDIVNFENGRLRLHDWPSFDLDLVQQAEDRWVGRLHRGKFDSTVTLRRAGISGPTKTNPIVGTWFYQSVAPSQISCIHIAQQAESEFTGWSDSLQVLGEVGFRNNLTRPETAFESYGELMKVHVDGEGKVTLELHAFSPACCSHIFVGKITQEGNLIQGDWPRGPNQSAGSGTWTKMSGDSCVSSPPSQAP
jgi:hypothetical protein